MGESGRDGDLLTVLLSQLSRWRDLEAFAWLRAGRTLSKVSFRVGRVAEMPLGGSRFPFFLVGGGDVGRDAHAPYS